MKNDAKVRKLLEKIAAGKISNKDAAKELDISTRTLSRLMLANEIVRPEGQTKYERAAARERTELKDWAAAGFATGNLTAEEAASFGKCSVRTIYRRVQKLKA